MGNSQDQVPVSDFPIQNYLNKGLTKEEVLIIRRIWDSLGPTQNVIKTSSIKELYQGRRAYDPALEKQGTINFDSFFAIFSRNLIEEKRRNGGTLPSDSLQMQASCLFCPYARDKGQLTS